jgi:hypothetical protein
MIRSATGLAACLLLRSRAGLGRSRYGGRVRGHEGAGRGRRAERSPHREDDGLLTILFGSQVADWQIDAVLEKLEQESAIHGVTHARSDTDFCLIR